MHPLHVLAVSKQTVRGLLLSKRPYGPDEHNMRTWDSTRDVTIRGEHVT